jgi:hypothetical protein
MFATVIPHKLLIASTSDSLNKRISDVLERIIPSLISKANDSFWHRLFGTTINLNEGLFKSVTLNDSYIAAHPELTPILHQAYQYLTEQGFEVDARMHGFITYDYYEVDSDVPVETNYAGQICDNNIDNGEYHSCTFVVQKDQVKGDHEIYTENPGILYEGKKFPLPITSNMILLRSGSLLYNVQPHIGKGKEMSITFHLATA